MRILALDVGTGTQDILLLDTAGPVENSVKLVMPSPTTIAAGRIRRATAAGRPVVLTGTNQGGGPCHWALEDHIRAGLPAFATPEAATTFDDDLDNVQRLGVRLVSDDEAMRTDGDRVRLRDLDLDAIRRALAAFDVDSDFHALAVGCLDHGAAPPGYSDRLFRFDHLRRVVEKTDDLRAFAYLPHELPEYLTRARAMTACIDLEAPTIFLDTGPAAALGALQDPAVGSSSEQVVLNLGNMHALAFHLRRERIVSLYEHHTGEMTTDQIESFTERLVRGDLRQEDVFDTKGHGVHYVDPAAARADLPAVAVTGPRRGRIRHSRLKPYFAAPHGDMMISGCFGMVRAFAYRFPQHAEEIHHTLTRSS
jgi:uncharacterized protein (DUF1786 family)